MPSQLNRFIADVIYKRFISTKKSDPLHLKLNSDGDVFGFYVECENAAKYLCYLNLQHEHGNGDRWSRVKKMMEDNERTDFVVTNETYVLYARKLIDSLLKLFQRGVPLMNNTEEEEVDYRYRVFICDKKTNKRQKKQNIFKKTCVFILDEKTKRIVRDMINDYMRHVGYRKTRKEKKRPIETMSLQTKRFLHQLNEYIFPMEKKIKIDPDEQNTESSQGDILDIPDDGLFDNLDLSLSDESNYSDLVESPPPENDYGDGISRTFDILPLDLNDYPHTETLFK